MIKEEYKYHHIGLPTTTVQKNEQYNEEWKFYGSGYFESQYGIEWLRIEKESKLHPLIKASPLCVILDQNLLLKKSSKLLIRTLLELSRTLNFIKLLSNYL